jgi:hypothetical protein
VATRQRDTVTPIGIDRVKLGQRPEAPRRPKARLGVPNRALHRSLLTRRRRRASRRVKSVVAAQLQKPRVPRHDVAVTPCDRRTQVVIDALTRNAAQPRQRADVPLQEGLDRHVKGEVRRRRTRIGQRADQRVNTALTPGDLRARRHLRPVDLQHLAGPVARALRRTHLPRAHRRHPLAHQIDRPAIAIVLAQNLRHARSLNLRPPIDQPANDRLERIKHRSRRRALIPRRLNRCDQPTNRPPIDPQPRSDLALRDPVRRHRSDLRPLHRAAHLPPPPQARRPDDLETPADTGQHRPREWRTIQFLDVAQYWAPGVKLALSAGSQAPSRTFAETS